MQHFYNLIIYYFLANVFHKATPLIPFGGWQRITIRSIQMWIIWNGLHKNIMRTMKIVECQPPNCRQSSYILSKFEHIWGGGGYRMGRWSDSLCSEGSGKDQSAGRVGMGGVSPHMIGEWLIASWEWSHGQTDRHDWKHYLPATSLLGSNYCPQRSLGKVMFLHVSVIMFTWGGSASVHAGIPPPRSRQPPDHAPTQEQTPPPPRTSHPQEQSPPGTRHPPRSSACWEIRAASGRYASYWNAFLLALLLEQKLHILVHFTFPFKRSTSYPKSFTKYIRAAKNRLGVSQTSEMSMKKPHNCA